MKKFFIIACIFFLALLLRLDGLNTIPNGLQLDELNAGYQGYKIIATGSDIYGNHLPLYVDRFGDYRAGGIFYLSGLSTYLLGFTNFAVRFPIALIGALTIIPLFFLTKIVSKNTSLAVIASALLAISPWHIVTSRATSESLMSLFAVTVGTVCLLLGIEKKKGYLFVLSFFTYIFSYFFYPSPRVFVPTFLFLITLCLYMVPSYFSLKRKTIGHSVLAVLIAVVIVTVGITFTKFGTGRFNQTSIFSSQDVRAQIKALNDAERGNILLARIFNNKPAVFGITFINQYFSYFSTEFLYIRGGLPQRYVVPNMGLFYYIEFPFALLGFYFLIRQRNPFFLIPIIWLFLAPIGASLTLEDSPNIQRTTFMIIPFMILEAYGIYFSVQACKPLLKTIFSCLIIFAFLLSGAYFLNMYFIQSPGYMSFERNDGNDRLFSYLKTVQNKYDNIYISSHEDLAMYYLFDTDKKTQLLSTTRQAYAQGYSDGKYLFVPTDCPSLTYKNGEKNNKRVLYVDNGNCIPNSNLVIVNRVIRKDTTTAYIISSKNDY